MTRSGRPCRDAALEAPRSNASRTFLGSICPQTSCRARGAGRPRPRRIRPTRRGATASPSICTPRSEPSGATTTGALTAATLIGGSVNGERPDPVSLCRPDELAECAGIGYKRCSRAAAACRLASSLAWGISSAGRAPGSHPGGQRFDSAMLHHRCQNDSVLIPSASRQLPMSGRLPGRCPLLRDHGHSSASGPPMLVTSAVTMRFRQDDVVTAPPVTKPHQPGHGSGRLVQRRPT